MGVLAGTQNLASAPLSIRSVELVDTISAGYQSSQLLLAAHRLGVFEALRDEPRTAASLTGILGADGRATRILCDALVAIGMLGRERERYCLTADARECLLPESPNSKYALLSHTARLYEQWGKLFDVVKTGGPVSQDAVDARLEGDAQSFARAMANASRDSAVTTAALLSLPERGRVLDVGGGPGVFAIEFARKESALDVVVLDRPEALEVARQNVVEAHLTDRIELRPGDAFVDDLGGPYDLVFLSNLVHLFSAEENERLLARCAAALVDGGRLVVKDFLLDADRTSPPGGAIFAVTMLLNTEKGDCYTISEVEGWFAAAGVRLETVQEVTVKSRVAIGVRL